MSQVPDTIESLPFRSAQALNEIARGMELKKCRKCGCMKDALDQAERAFESAEEPEIRSLVPRIAVYQARMQPLAYDCIGCKKCWGADATNELANNFDEVELDTCGSDDEHASGGIQSAIGSSNRSAHASAVAAWPPHPGDYIVGNPEGTVAICTLSNRDLAVHVTAAGEPAVAIAGRCDTENIGVEKVVLNLLANPRIRWLVICGTEARGHRAGDAFLRLKERGVDADMRVLESASWRPILKNLTLLDVAQFRQQIEEVNLIGVTELESILAAARECANKPVQASTADPAEASCRNDKLAAIEHIPAKAPKQLRLDRAGFFIVLPQPQKRLIVCEHYENNGRLAHVIEGRQAALIAATAVERGFVTQLDHAAYLGRELAKAETALSNGTTYEQDAALGVLAAAEPAQQKESHCQCSKT
jgi:tetrahydromethanopterin S-methyltransferase subunit A